MNRNRGITLIALVITIIVLLILAGVSISMLSGDNGLLKKAGQARDDTIIGEEREQVELAYISAAVKKLGDDVTYSELQEELDANFGDTGKTDETKKKTKVTRNANNTLNVLFRDTQHNFNVDNGKVAKVDDDGGNQSGDYDKIYAYFYNKTYNDYAEWDDNIGTVYKDNTTVGILGTELTEIGSKENRAMTANYTYIEYNNNMYVFVYDYNTDKVSDVKNMNINKNVFGEYGSDDWKVLITPIIDDNTVLIHISYDGPDTYYKWNNETEDYDIPFTGYCAYDNDGYNRYYDTSGALVQVEERLQ